MIDILTQDVQQFTALVILACVIGAPLIVMFIVYMISEPFDK